MTRSALALIAFATLALAPAPAALAEGYRHGGGGDGRGGGESHGDWRGGEHGGGWRGGYLGVGGGPPRRESRPGAFYDGEPRRDWSRPELRSEEWRRREEPRRDLEGPPRNWRGQRWDGEHYNGYYYQNRWYFGPPPGAYYGQQGFQLGFSPWRRGARLPPYYAGWTLDAWQHYHLRRPPAGYHWVRIGNDFLLVNDASGVIFDIIEDGRF